MFNVVLDTMLAHNYLGKVSTYMTLLKFVRASHTHKRYILKGLRSIWDLTLSSYVLPEPTDLESIYSAAA